MLFRSPEDFARVYREALEEADHVLSLHISGKLSGTVQSADLAAQEFPGRVMVVDTQAASLGVGMMVLFTLALTPAILYAREKGGSLWAPALLHGTLNAVAGLSLLAVERTHDLLVGVVGLPGLFLLALFNLWLRRRV